MLLQERCRCSVPCISSGGSKNLEGGGRHFLVPVLTQRSTCLLHGKGFLKMLSQWGGRCRPLNPPLASVIQRIVVYILSASLACTKIMIGPCTSPTTQSCDTGNYSHQSFLTLLRIKSLNFPRDASITIDVFLRCRTFWYSLALILV